MNSKHKMTDWQSMADPAIVKVLGSNIKQMRLNKNLSQSQLAKFAGLGTITISRMENGKTTTILTIVQVLRVLGKLDILDAFQEDAQVSPLQMLRLKKKERQRASKSRKPKKNE